MVHFVLVSMKGGGVGFGHGVEVDLCVVCLFLRWCLPHVSASRALEFCEISLFCREFGTRDPWLLSIC